MQERTDSHFRDLDQTIKERLFTSLVDLITMATLVSVSPTVKEIAIAVAKGEKRDVSVYQEFQTQISIVQRDAIWWFHMKVDPIFGPSEKDYVHCLNKVLFLEGNDTYQNKDNWPPESERPLLLNLVREVPLTEDALLRLLILGLSEEFPINCADTLDIVDRLIQRAAVLKSGLTGLEIERLDVIEMVLSLCVYVHPKEISLPQGYQPPTLAISNLYWKGWTLLLILAACNPKTLGLSCWEGYPTLRSMMEIIITRNYTFPPLVTGDVTTEEVRAAELQLNRAEKEDVLLFESHLAAATTGQTITESNSLLISQLISLDPGGPSRQPPQTIIERLKTLNSKLGLGYMFCRSREPDFLLDIIRSQGSSRSMPWLADLVESSEGSLSVLPAQCLCEFLLMKDGQWKKERKDGSSLDKKSIRLQVIKRLQELLKGIESSDQTTREVVEYFLNRLASAEMRERDAAVRALKAILNFPKQKKIIKVKDISPQKERKILSDQESDVLMSADEMEVDDEKNAITDKTALYKAMFPDYTWLLIALTQLQFFDALLISVVYAIRQAVYVEMDVERLQAYIVFLSQHISELNKDELDELVEDISQLVTTRSTLLSGLIAHNREKGAVAYKSLLQLYVTCLNEALGSGEYGYEWQHNDEKVYVTWSNETLHPDKTATLHVRVIHAAIVLLTCGPPQDDRENYDILLDTWFPENGFYEVRLADTGEEAALLQDWLRMKMVTSNVPRLVDTGLLGLIPTQLVIFMQTFGLPVESMSKLLHCLDEAALRDPMSMSQAGIDRDYMLQLVDVQWSRGATGGETFCSFLAQEPYQNQQETIDLAELEDSIEPLSAQLPNTTQVKQEVQRSYEFHIENVKSLFLKLYCDAKVSSTVMEEFMELKKRLSIECISNVALKTDVSDTVLMAILQILQLESGGDFMRALFEKSTLTCPLLEILSKTKCEFKQFLSVLSRNIIEGSKVAVFVESFCKKLGLRKDADSSASSLVAEFKRQLTKTVASSEKAEINNAATLALKVLKAGIESMKIGPNDLDRKLIREACKVIQEHNLPLFEKLLDVVCRCYIDVASTKQSINFSYVKDCVELLVDLYGDAIHSKSHMAQGIIVDWLEILDPEIAHVHPLLQRELLFLDREKASNADHMDRNKTPTSYLAALLAHQSRGNTLHDCIEWLLSVDIKSTKLNPTAALDLINSVVNNPRLWQGRDSKQNTLDEDKGRRINDEVMLDIATPQLCKLAELILAEMEAILQPSKVEPGDITMTAKVKVNESRSLVREVIQVAEKRLPLMLNHVTNLNSKKMERVISNIKRNKRYSKEVTDCFLQQLYLQKPNMLGHHVKEIPQGKYSTTTQGKECEITPATEDLLPRGIENKAVVNHRGFGSYNTKQVKSSINHLPLCPKRAV